METNPKGDTMSQIHTTDESTEPAGAMSEHDARMVASAMDTAVTEVNRALAVARRTVKTDREAEIISEVLHNAHGLLHIAWRASIHAS